MSDHTISKTKSIENFLKALALPDLAILYNPEMEVQVNVARDNGEIISNEFQGREYNAYTDGLTEWKPIRIPFNASSEPEFRDTPITFDLVEHAEGIGMTGWNWVQKKSIYIAFDFDSIVNHKVGLRQEELQEIREACSKLDYVEIRRSTSGTGYHLYVFLNSNETISNHTEHAAVARAILNKISVDTGFDLQGKVDVCGHNIWIWHRKQKNTDGLTLVKKSTAFAEIPHNWRDHLDVVRKKRHKIKPSFIENEEEESEFDLLVGQEFRIPLDEDHKKLTNYLSVNNCYHWWDNDHYMLVCHTFDLKQAHASLDMKGVFDTIATGKDRGSDHNCFAFPQRNGCWIVRRYSKGTSEAPTWERDSAGFTRCYFNRDPDLRSIARMSQGVESEKGGYIFKDTSSANDASKIFGVIIDVNAALAGRETILKEHKDGRLIVKVKRESSDDGGAMSGWQPSPDNYWTRIYQTRLSLSNDEEEGNYDNIVRHLVTESGQSYDWVIKTMQKRWVSEPRENIKLALQAIGYSKMKADRIMGKCVFESWKLMNRPFAPEYLGNKEWNLHAPQLRFKPKPSVDNLYYPHWKKILDHCGAGLNDAVKQNSWCVANGIILGSDYLKCWMASILQQPLQPLPYLFFYGEQNSGKSMFHEAFSLLITGGYVRANTAITNESGFNGELENAVICIIEEQDLKRNKTAYNRVKDWVTSVRLPIHKKQKTPYHVPNTTHWAQFDNFAVNCPMFPGDTRITMIKVPNLSLLDAIPKKQFLPKLEQEASDFTTALLALEIPPSPDRLNIPALMTSDKIALENSNESDIQTFLREMTVPCDGHLITVNDMWLTFQAWLDPNEQHKWSKIKMGKEFPITFPKGREHGTAAWSYGNITFDKTASPKAKLFVDDKQFLSH